jgi:hypothetical protein
LLSTKGQKIPIQPHTSKAIASAGIISIEGHLLSGNHPSFGTAETEKDGLWNEH